MSADGHAEARYQDSVELLSQVPVALDLAHTRLLFGEWLRRRRRRGEARAPARGAPAVRLLRRRRVRRAGAQPPDSKTGRPHRTTAGNQAAQDRPGPPASQDYVLHARLGTVAELSEDAQRAQLSKYMAAFDAMDVDALKRTLREDALLQMPPFPAWFSGRDAVAQFHVSLFARGGSFRFVPTRSNGQLAFGIYLRRDTDMFVFRHIQVLTVFANGIARIDAFQAKGLAEAFGLPEERPD
jgi:hypothetical protein